jgi:hypothetical protein
LADMMVAAKLITQVGHVDRFNGNVTWWFIQNL